MAKTTSSNGIEKSGRRLPSLWAKTSMGPRKAARRGEGECRFDKFAILGSSYYLVEITWSISVHGYCLGLMESLQPISFPDYWVYVPELVCQT